jgi:hypothetical protein
LSSLSSLLGNVMAVFEAHPTCQRATVVETKVFSSDQFLFKVRADFMRGSYFQARIYYNQGHIDYAYQLFSRVPILRWDNKEEFRYLKSYPHHQHDDEGKIKASPLTGDPLKDIKFVLHEVDVYLSDKIERKDRCGLG